MVPCETIDLLNELIELHKNLAIGYTQALRSEGISSFKLKSKLKEKEKAFSSKYG
jgi:hypothetical protein